jgi:hypothetical protein
LFNRDQGRENASATQKHAEFQQNKARNHLSGYKSNPNPVEDQVTPGETPTCELDFKPKGFTLYCRNNCGCDNAQYRCRMGSYVIYLCGECLFVRFLDLMVVDPPEEVEAAAS